MESLVYYQRTNNFWYSNEQLAKKAIKQAKSLEISILGVLVTSDVQNSKFMQEICDVYVETNYGYLSEELQRLNMCI